MTQSPERPRCTRWSIRRDSVDDIFPDWHAPSYKMLGAKIARVGIVELERDGERPRRDPRFRPDQLELNSLMTPSVATGPTSEDGCAWFEAPGMWMLLAIDRHRRTANPRDADLEDLHRQTFAEG
jgi:hypothetical protein